MQLRGQMQEMTLKYENQKTVAESLENIKQSLQKSHAEMQQAHTRIQTENEKHKRTIYTKEKLLEAQEVSNQGYVAMLRQEQKKLELKFETERERFLMEYEELRTQTCLHWKRIKELEGIRDQLEKDLADMTQNRDDLVEKLRLKNIKFDELMDKFEKKMMELINEK